MRTLNGVELEKAQSYDANALVKLEVQNDSGTWIDVGALLGKDWIVNASWGEDRDTQVSQATFTLVQAVGANSLAPLMTASPLNVDDFAAYAPLLQKGRLMRAFSASLPPGNFTPRQHRNEFFWANDLTRTASWGIIAGATATALDRVGLDGKPNTASTVTDNSATNYGLVTQSKTCPNNSNPVYTHFWIEKDNDQSRTPQLIMTLSGGTATGGRRCKLNTATGDFLTVNTTGIGIGGTTTITLERWGGKDWWHVVMMITNNSTGNTSIQSGLYPAPNASMAGGDLVTVQGSVGVGAIMVEFNPAAPSWLPVITQGAALTIDDWKPAVTGRIDRVQTSSSELFGLGPITLQCSDLGAWLMDLQIETEGTQYGDPVTPPTLESVIQAVINANIPVGEPAVTLVKQSLSNFGVTDYRQGEVKLLEALSELVLDSVGEDIRYRFDAAHISQLMWFNPDRGRVTVDATFARYIMHTLGQSIDDIRNSGELSYIEAGVPGVVTSEDAFSLAEYRKRFFRLPFNKGLATEAQAQTVIDAVVHDLSDSPAEAEVELPFCWFVQLFDRYTFAANGEHYDEDQTFGVGGYTHTIENGQGSTTLSPLTSRIVGAYERWKNKLTTPVGAPLVCPAITLSEKIVGGAPRLTLYRLIISFTPPTSPDYDYMEFEVVTDTTGDVSAVAANAKESPATVNAQPDVTYTVNPFVVSINGDRTPGTQQSLLISNTMHVGPTRLVLPVGTDLWAT